MEVDNVDNSQTREQENSDDKVDQNIHVEQGHDQKTRKVSQYLIDECQLSALKRHVTCPVCKKVPESHIYPMCPNGHLVCKTCFDNLTLNKTTTEDKRCPTCRSGYGMTLETCDGLHGPPPKSTMAQVMLRQDYDSKEHFMAAVREEVTCPVCLDIPRVCDFVSCPNGHLVCEICFENLAPNVHTGNKKCPTCRSKFGISFANCHGIHGPAIKNTFAHAVLDIVILDCRFDNCNSTASRYDIEDHESVCDHAELKCPITGCKNTHTYDNLVSHLLNEHLDTKEEGSKFIAGSCNCFVSLPPHGRDYQGYILKLLTDNKGNIIALMMLETNSLHQELKAYMYFLGKPEDRLKHKVKITIGHPNNTDEDFVYVGRMYGGGNATLEYQDKIGLVLPERLCRYKLTTCRDGKWGFKLVYELI